MMRIIPPPPPILKRGGARLFSVAVLLALGLTAMSLTIAVGDDRVAEAQQITTIQVTPDNFSTYFDIDSTTEVATLNSAYASDHTLVLGPGIYRNSILVENASNLVIRGANNADSAQPATLQANRIIEDARGSGNGAIFQVRSSSNVTVDNLLFDYQCLFDASPRTALYGLFYQDTSGTISNNFMENYWYAFGTDENGRRIPNPCGDLTRGLGDILLGIPTSLNHASFRAIRVDMTSSHVPDIDANGKVTNLLPIRIAGNKISRVDRLGIGIYGYFDATIEDNTIHDANTVMQITGGADAKVLNNHISYTTVALIYAPHWFVRNSPDGETVNAEIEVRGNVIDGASGGAIQLGFAWARADDGTTVHTNAKIIGNHFLNLRQDRTASVGSSVGISVYSEHKEDERIRAEVIGNTFEQRSSDSDNDPTGIYGSSAYLASATDSSTWFDLRVHYNAFIGFQERDGRGVWITNKEGTTTFPVGNARVHASHNYWGPELRIPSDFIQDNVGQPDVAGIISDLHLIDLELAGHEGPYGTGARTVPSELPEIVRFTASTGSLTVVEGQTASFDVALESVPSRDVLINLIANNPDISISPSSITFTPDDWDTPRTVSISGRVDHDIESGMAIVGALISDVDYPGGYAALVDVRIQDLGLQAHHRINRLAPSISKVTVRGGDTIRLGVVPYGRQNIADDALIDGKTGVIWTVDEGSGRFAEADPSLDIDTFANDRVVEFTAPESPGTYTIHATLASCGDSTGEDCRASFTVVVRRSSPAPEPTVAPTNPSGDIPSILVGDDGAQYEVFTPEEGGSFVGEDFSIVIPPAAVSNGEFIGVRIAEAGPASNVGMTLHRYTLGGNRYSILALDQSSAEVSSYILDSPGELCLPMPVEFRGNIRDIALVAIHPDDTLTILSARLKIGGPSLRVCGSLSELPATVSVGTAGSPAALPTAMPEQPDSEQLPETGGYVPDVAFWTMLLIFIMGLITVGSSFRFAVSLRQRSGRR